MNNYRVKAGVWLQKMTKFYSLLLCVCRVVLWMVYVEWKRCLEWIIFHGSDQLRSAESWLAKFSIIYAGKYSNDIIDNVKDGDKSSPPPRLANDCLQLKHWEICSSALFRILSWTKTHNKKLQDIAQRRTGKSICIFSPFIREYRLLLLHLANLAPVLTLMVNARPLRHLDEIVEVVCKKSGPVEDICINSPV